MNSDQIRQNLSKAIERGEQLARERSQAWHQKKINKVFSIPEIVDQANQVFNEHAGLYTEGDGDNRSEEPEDLWER